MLDILILRTVNFLKEIKIKILFRTAFENDPVNIVGMVLNNRNLYKCLKIKKIIDVKNISKKIGMDIKIV